MLINCQKPRENKLSNDRQGFMGSQGKTDSPRVIKIVYRPHALLIK